MGKTHVLLKKETLNSSIELINLCFFVDKNRALDLKIANEYWQFVNSIESLFRGCLSDGIIKIYKEFNPYNINDFYLIGEIEKYLNEHEWQDGTLFKLSKYHYRLLKSLRIDEVVVENFLESIVDHLNLVDSVKSYFQEKLFSSEKL